MTVKSAMESYFSKLNQLYAETFGTLPTVSWSPDLDQDLFLGTPDEDGEIQWSPKEAAPVAAGGLCKELQEFYGSYYYWEIRGEYRSVLFDFPAVPSSKKAEMVVNAAIANGEYYFPQQGTVLVATCSYRGNDDLLLFYHQKKSALYIYDADKKRIKQLDCSLIELINSMKAVI